MEKIDELILDYLLGKLKGRRAAEFLELMEKDAECARRFEELSRLYASSMRPRYEASRESNWTHLRRRMGYGRRPVSFSRWAYAALALVIGVFSGFYGASLLRKPAVQEALCEISVPSGSRTSIMLPDSSTVWLNSGARLSYSPDFGKKTRDVNLCGEAFFEVSRDEKKPFVVNADALKVKVLGTKFNVCTEEESGNCRVDLLKGKVEVFTEGGESLVLDPGQQAVYDRESGVLRAESSDPYVADWVNGRMSFVNMPLTEIFEKLEKQFNVRIVFQDDKSEGEYFTGSIDLSLTLYEMLRYIDVDRKYKVEFSDGVIYVSAKN